MVWQTRGRGFTVRWSALKIGVVLDLWGRGWGWGGGWGQQQEVVGLVREDYWGVPLWGWGWGMVKG